MRRGVIDTSRPLTPARLVSLDAFRGIAMAGMILVNNPGTWRSVYWPLRHASWNGCTPADLIFPFFLFTVGVAVALSIAPSAKRGQSRWGLVVKTLRRGLTIFGLGVFLNGFPRFDLSVLRIPGVLQRIALCYVCASIAVLTLRARGQSLSATILLFGYWAMMSLIPVPGHTGRGLTPDVNLAASIDRALLRGHLLHDRWDPEGLLSTLPAVGTTLFGVLTGHWLRSAPTASRCALGPCVGGGVAVVGGLAMGVWFPINKGLWTSSYAVFTAGVALILFATCYWLIDVRGYRSWAVPFIVYGTNSIVAYVLSSLMAKVLLLWTIRGADGSRIPLQQYLFEAVFLRLARPLNASLLYAVAYVILWLGITGFLYRRRIIIKI